MIGAALWIASFLFLSTVPLSGDEIFYASAGAAIGKFLSGDLSFLEMRTVVVGNGWFTPGIPVVLSPVYLFDPTPHYAVVRLYASFLTFLLWVWALREVNRVFGLGYSVALFIFPALDVTWHFLAGAIWGDLSAGLLLIIILGRIWEIAQRAFEGTRIKWREMLVLEALLVLVFYMRGNSILVAVAIHIFLLAVLLLSGRWQLLTRQGAVLMAGMILFTIGVAPWSIMASRTLGGVVISTSTPALSFGITFGERQYLCFGPCPKVTGNIWIDSAHFSRVYAAEHGGDQIETQSRMAASATRNLTFTTYATRVRANFDRFLFHPAGFTENRFLPGSSLRFSKQTVELAGRIASIWTGVLYFPFLLALAVANGMVVIRGWREQLESLCIKMFTLCLFVQPLVNLSHSRYWPAFATLMAISAAFLFKMARSDNRAEEPGSTTLTAIQAIYVALVLVVATWICLAGIAY